MTDFIAEFCQNHNGDFGLLESMVAAAADAGATHGKMQSITADMLAFRPEFESGVVVEGRHVAIKRPYGAEYRRLKGLEISMENTRKFIEACKSSGLIPMTTCFARSQATALSDIGFSAIKVASYDCASFPMLRELKQLFNQVVISTGATFDDEIEHAASIMKGSDFALLHCVTMYPTPLDQLHLARMERLRELCPRVGYSDHSHVEDTGLIASKAALLAGADIVERHFTILPAHETKDGPVSINAEQLRELVAFGELPTEEQEHLLDQEFPTWRITVGQRDRLLTSEELLNRGYYRGRFASPRLETTDGSRMIFNWEETPV